MDESGELALTALGASVVVRIEGAGANDIAADLRERWSRCLDDESDAVPRLLTYRLGAEGVVMADPLLQRITIDVTAAALDHCRGDLLTLHAAGLEDGDIAYCFVGPSGAGKSTLASRLGRHLGYAGDEAVGIDADGRLVAFPKPLSLRSAATHKQQLGPDALGLRPVSGRRPLGGLFVLDRQTDAAAPPSAEALDLVEAIVALASQSSYLPQFERPLQRVATLIRRHGAYRLTYAESAAVLDVVRATVAEPIPGGRWEWALPEDAALPRAAAGEPALRRAEVHDAIADAGGTVVVLRGTELQVLSPVGSLIWRLTSNWTRREDIEHEVCRIAGLPPAQRGTVGERLDEMAARGLIRMRE